jgi:hypothetical protein
MTIETPDPTVQRIGVMEMNLEQLLQSLQRVLHWRYPAKESQDDEKLSFWGRFVEETIEELRCDAFSVRPWQYLEHFFYCVQVAGGLSEREPAAVEFSFSFVTDVDLSETVRNVDIVWLRPDIRIKWQFRQFSGSRVASVIWEWLEEVNDQELKKRFSLVIIGGE